VKAVQQSCCYGKVCPISLYSREDGGSSSRARYYSHPRLKWTVEHAPIGEYTYFILQTHGAHNVILELKALGGMGS